jgi:hypothetical protein
MGMDTKNFVNPSRKPARRRPTGATRRRDTLDQGPLLHACPSSSPTILERRRFAAKDSRFDIHRHGSATRRAERCMIRPRQRHRVTRPAMGPSAVRRVRDRSTALIANVVDSSRTRLLDGAARGTLARDAVPDQVQHSAWLRRRVDVDRSRSPRSIKSDRQARGNSSS